MVNNHLIGVFLKRSCFFTLIIFLTGQHTFGQKIKNYYVSSLQKEGTLYFIEPKKVFRNSQDDQLSYDLTFETQNDSIILNFSYLSNEIKPIDSLIVTQQSEVLASAASKLFVSDQKRQWKHRYSARFDYESFTTLYKSETRPKLQLVTNDKYITLTIPPKKWDRERIILRKIFMLINFNRMN